MGEQLGPVKGGLETLPLAELIPQIAETRSDGVLTLSRGPQRRTFDIVAGSVVRSSSSDPREYRGQYLVDYGLLSSRAAARAFRSQEASRVLLGKLLPVQEAIDEDRVRAALVAKITEGLLDSYRWEHGEVEFAFAAPDVGDGVQVKVFLGDVHREAMQRAKLWKEYRKLFPSPEARLRLAPQGTSTPGAVQPDEEVILELAEAGQTVASALEAFRDGEFHVYRRLTALVEKGRLLPAELDPWAQDKGPDSRRLLEAAKVMLHSGRPAEAASLAARACEGAPSSLALEVLRQSQQSLALQLAEELLSKEGKPYVRARTGELQSLELQPAEHYLLMRIDAGDDLSSLVAAAPMGELEALRILNRLVQAGLIGFAKG